MTITNVTVTGGVGDLLHLQLIIQTGGAAAADHIWPALFSHQQSDVSTMIKCSPLVKN